MTAQTMRVVLVMEKKHFDAIVWEMAMRKDPEGVARSWLREHGVKVLDVQPPRAYENGSIRMPVRLSKNLEQKVHQLSGIEGVTTGRFIESDP